MKKQCIMIISLFLTIGIIIFPFNAFASEHTGSFETDAVETDLSSQFTQDPDQLLLGYFEGQLFGNLDLFSEIAGSRLGEKEYAAYLYMKNALAQIAAGNRASTIIDIPLSAIGVDTSKAYTDTDLGLTGPVHSYVNGVVVRDEAMYEKADAAISEMCGLDWDSVFNAILADCPYEQYWSTKHFKCSGVKYTYDTSYDPAAGSVTTYFRITSADIKVSVSVAGDYSGSGEYTVNTAKTRAASKAAANAQKIVNAARNMSDYEKLVYYKDTICAMVGYDLPARSAYDYEHYGTIHPWQVIYVFDDDPSNKVICEGYSKAFKYLCDMTAFDSPRIKCMVVIGTMIFTSGTFEHYWNVVTMSDGKNYLVDVTDCDANTIGYPDQLFLVGGGSNRDVRDWYSYELKRSYAYFRYYEKSISMYGEENLVLADRDFRMCQKESDHCYESSVIREATCTAAGTIKYTCAVCGASYTETVPATGHAQYLIKTDAKAATCTGSGNKEYWTCSQCNKIFSDSKGQNEINAEDTVITATEHDPVSVPAVAATCTETGLTEGERCLVCGAIIKAQEIIPATDHNWGEWVVISEATEAEEGYEMRTCKNDASHTETKAIPKPGHIHSFVRTDAVAATCTEAGHMEYWKCSVCGKCFIDAEGEQEINIEDTIIPAAGHNAVSVPAVIPTCTESGLTEGYYCSVCGEIIRPQETVPATGHSYINNVCVVCGDVQVQNGFVKVNDIWCWYQDGEFQTHLTGLIRGTIEGRTAWYYIDNGYFTRYTGFTQLADRSNNKWYYVSDGQIKTGWVKNNNKYYYFNPANGALKTGWIRSGGKYYYINPSTGTLKTGWLKYRGSYYYLNPKTGTPVTGKQKINGKTYTFNAKGVCVG